MPFTVPYWCGALIATADTQKDHFYFTIRAWGYAFRSQLVHYGRAQTFDELYRVCLESVFRTEDGRQARPHLLMIDSGGTVSSTNPEESRTQEVYQFSMRDLGRVYPCKGASHAMRRPWEVSKIGDAGVTIRLLDTGYYKDMLARLMNTEVEDAAGKIQLWMPHNAVGDDYCQQMASEHKIIDRKRGNRLVWVKVTSGAANHIWDCETLQCAAADMVNIATLPPPVAPQAKAEAAQQQPEPPPQSGGWATGHKGRW
jgi:phage terminase large subunit GpA-like protein